jgi:hypothetical protein
MSFETDRLAAEMAKQNALAAAHAGGLSAANLRVAVASADRAYFSRIVASGLVNNVQVNGAREALARSPVSRLRVSLAPITPRSLCWADAT